MSGEQYIVKGQIVVDSAPANAAMRTLTKNTSDAQKMVTNMGPSINGLLGRVAAFAGAFVGVRTVLNQVQGALEFHNQLEQNTAGMAAMFRAVDHEGFASSMTHASAAFMDIDAAAAEAFGETSDLFNIMRTGYSDMTRAGMTWAQQLELVKSAANTAGIVGVGLDFVGRDLQEMLAGRAHMATNQLFTRAIAPLGHTSEEFNAMPNNARLRLIQEVLQTMGGGEGAAQIGRGLAAQTATVASKFKMLRESFFKPFFSPDGLIPRAMSRVTAALSTQRMLGLMSRLEGLGNSLATSLGPMFMRIADSIVYAMEHVDETVGRVRSAMANIVTSVAKVAALRVGIAGVAAAGTHGAAISGGVAAIGPMVSAVMVGLRGLFMAIPAMMAGIIPAITNGFLTALVMIMSPTVALAGLQTLWISVVGFLTAMNPLVLVFAAVAGLAMMVAANWQRLSALFVQATPIFAYIGQVFTETFGAVWNVVSSLMQIIGELIGPGVMLGLILIMGAFVLAMKALKLICEGLMLVLEPLKNAIHSFFEEFLMSIQGFMMALGMGDIERTGVRGLGAGSAATGVHANPAVAAATGAPGARTPPTHNDFRGSHIRVNQEFKEADPDRVMHQIVNDINRQAERRISSGQTSPLTR